MALFKKKEQPKEQKEPVEETPIVEPTPDQKPQEGPELIFLEQINAQNIEGILENMQRQNMILTELLEVIKKK